MPLKAELIEIRVSGRMEISAITIKPMMYLDRLKLSAILEEYLIARVAPLITMNNENVKIKKFAINLTEFYFGAATYLQPPMIALRIFFHRLNVIKAKRRS